MDLKEFEIVAESSADHADFAPVVPSINDHGTVAFWSRAESGKSQLWTAEPGRAPERVEHDLGDDVDFISHPDINNAGQLAVYVEWPDKRQAVALLEKGRSQIVVETGELVSGISPLGPTLTESGTIGFRATVASREAVGQIRSPYGDGIQWVLANDAGSPFFGLPGVWESGATVFRTCDENGKPIIEAVGPEGDQSLFGDFNGFLELGFFPHVQENGSVLVAGKHQDHGLGVFSYADGEIKCVVNLESDFESVRGALCGASGPVTFYATPKGGSLGIFQRTLNTTTRLVAIGDEFEGSEIEEFALNPVSVNRKGRITLRIKLSCGRQAILRQRSL